MASNQSQSNDGSNSGLWSWNSDHEQRMLNLLETGFLSDITLVVGPEKTKFKVHKLILQAGSPVFYLRLSGIKDKEEVRVDDVDSETFGTLLRFLYTGTAPESFDDFPCMELLKLGSEYQIQDLMDLCARQLKRNLVDQNVISIYQNAMECGHATLIDSSLTYFCRNAWKIVELEDFLELRQECLYEALKSDDFMVCSELQLFTAVMRWGEAECIRQNLEPESENIRKALFKLLGLIRFPAMDQAEFTMNVALKNILVTDELVSILLYFTVPMAQRSEIPPGKFNSTPRNYYRTDTRQFSTAPVQNQRNPVQHSAPKLGRLVSRVFEPQATNYIDSKNLGPVFQSSSPYVSEISSSIFGSLDTNPWDPTSTNRVYFVNRLGTAAGMPSNMSHWSLVTNKIENLMVRVNERVVLSGLLYSLYPENSVHYNQRERMHDWNNVLLNFKIATESGNQIVSEMQPGLSRGKISFIDTILEANTWYTLTLAVTGTGVRDHFAVQTNCITEKSTEVTTSSARQAKVTFYFGRPQETTSNLPINQGFINDLLFKY